MPGSIQDLPGEIWKPVVGLPARYTISTCGRVKSSYGNGRILRPATASNGYLSVALFRKSAFIHHLVAAAFIGPRPAGHDVRHLDGNRLNNAVVNIGYGTRSDNMADCKRHGTLTTPTATGSANGFAKLDEAAVRRIKLALRDGETGRAIARAHGVTAATVSLIKRGKVWRHVHLPPLDRS